MTDLESDITMLRELDAQRVESGKLRDEGVDALIALCSPLFCVGDIPNVASVISELQSDTQKTELIPGFIWGKLSVKVTQLLADPILPLPRREFAFIEELNRILLGTSIYDRARFGGVGLRPDTRWLNEQNPAGTRLSHLNRLLLEDTYLRIPKKLDIFTDAPYVSAALWEQPSSTPPENLTELMGALENLKPEVLVVFPLAIPLAVRIVQALTAAPCYTFSQLFLCCYYLIIRELYTATPHDWTVGGARADPKCGMVSAYMTRECVRALLSLIHVLENTTNFLAELSEIYKRADQLERMLRLFPKLEKWVSVEKERLKLALQSTVQRSTRRLVLHPPEFNPSSMTIEEYIKEELAPQLKTTAENAVEGFTKALTAISTIHDKLSKYIGSDEISQVGGAEAGHRIAESALERGQANANALLEILTQPDDWYIKFKEWKKLEEVLKKISTQIRGLLRPVKKFLSSVLDRELAASAGGNYGEWNVVEMACAAAAYGMVTNEWGDDRLRCAVDSLKKVVSDRGRFPIGRPYHIDRDGSSCYPYNTVVIEALAQILKEAGADALRLKQPIAISVEPVLVRKILCFFKDTRADKPVGIENNGIIESKCGWRRDYISPPFLTEPLVTARTVQSLALINRMLDEQINARVLYHFSVKQPKDLERGPNLNTFFYPDYGLRQGLDSTGWAGGKVDSGKVDSIAIVLQKMRAHLAGLKSSDMMLCSLVLYGPQGTGKTTIAEALASSSQVPLVEVTPSDLLVEGGEAVERWARIIFEALSLLTRAVILFDEFDPVLWSRDVGGRRSGPSSVFAFLTASMLPKLQKLHKTAEKRSVVYVLITNFIGSLDEATVRQGRFDKKVGIYPPDVLSRAGRFLSEADDFLREKASPEDLPNDDKSKDRLREIIAEFSMGAGMQGLNQEGWFRRPDNKKCPKIDTPLYYYTSRDANAPKPKQLKRDAVLQEIKGVGPDAVREYREWDWVNTWDTQFKKKGFQALGEPPAELRLRRVPFFRVFVRKMKAKFTPSPTD